MNIALAQFNPTVGDFEGNSTRILELAHEAQSRGAELAVFSELCLCGYPPQDLSERPAFDELNQKDAEILPYPLQRALVRHLSIPAEKAGRPELLPLWAGQSASLSRSSDVHALLDTLVHEVSEIGSAVQTWSAHRQPTKQSTPAQEKQTV